MALSWRLPPQRILEFEFSFEELGDSKSFSRAQHPYSKRKSS